MSKRYAWVDDLSTPQQLVLAGILIVAVAGVVALKAWLLVLVLVGLESLPWASGRRLWQLCYWTCCWPTPAADLLQYSHPTPPDIMTSNLAISLLRRGRNGNQILEILETLTAEVEQENIADFLNHAATLQEIQF
jgi:hypothetical protein